MHEWVGVAVDGGERAVMYDRLQGVLPEAIGEGTHLRVPWVQMPTIMDIRTRPRSISSVTGTKGAPCGFGSEGLDRFCITCQLRAFCSVLGTASTIVIILGPFVVEWVHAEGRDSLVQCATWQRTTGLGGSACG